MSPMTDSLAVGAALTMFSTALNTVKQVRELAKSSSDTELKEKVSDLFDVFLDLKERLTDLEAENQTLKQQLEDKGNLERRQPYGYWYRKDDPDPLCPVCYERDEKIVHLDAPFQSSNGSITRFCKVCKESYYERRPQSRPINDYIPY